MQGIRFFVENTTNGRANVILTHHQAHFDIPFSLSGLNNSGAVLYRGSTRNNTPRIAPDASFTPSKPMTEVLVQKISLNGLIRALVTMFTSPNPLIEAFVANRAEAGFIAPNANQFKAPFVDLKPLNGYLLHAIVEFKGFGFVGMAFCRFALGNSGAITTCCGASSSRIAPKFPTDG
jgi:hypothetical protein